MNEMLNQILVLLGGFIMAVLAIVIPTLGKLVGEYLGKKIEAKQQEIGLAEYDSNKKLALDLCKIVEERFRLGELVGSKSDEFTKLLLEKVPYVTESQVKDLRDLAVRTFDTEIGKYAK
ncbi:hypothetical protein [Clostridium sp. ZBS18]|uniref:hypothetical protein n=1 Tax=Clostridium sp. ZBS18 TaxID=2949967 RepID=UPI002079B72C|nr:hypothetical protein [Clostridium sp. ZBS18]